MKLGHMHAHAHQIHTDAGTHTVRRIFPSRLHFNHIPVFVQSQMKMKSTDVVDGGLFTESYCNICNAQLISESQRTAHYEVSRPALTQSSQTEREDANGANLKGRFLRRVVRISVICTSLSMCCPKQCSSIIQRLKSVC